MVSRSRSTLNDEKNPVTGALFVDTEINGIKVKSGLQILLESANANTMDGWSRFAASL